jgi:hypothetical protein
VPISTTVGPTTLGLSILLHGVTAAWSTARYGAWYRAARASDPDLPEAQAGAEVTVRRLALAGSRRAPE